MLIFGVFYEWFDGVPIVSTAPHKGPVSVGRIHPTMDATTHMTTAMIRDLIQPIEYSICNASSHTIPAMNAASNPWPSRA